MEKSVSICSCQESRLCTCSRSKRATPQCWRDVSIWPGPRAPGAIHTLSAEKRCGGLPSFFKPAPMTSCEEQYIGEESIIRPPASKKLRMTSVQSARATRSSPTLKVIQLPSPITGNASPLDGIRRVIKAPCGVVPAAGPSAALAPSASRIWSKWRRRGCKVCSMEDSPVGYCPDQATCTAHALTYTAVCVLFKAAIYDCYGTNTIHRKLFHQQSLMTSVRATAR